MTPQEQEAFKTLVRKNFPNSLKKEPELEGKIARLVKKSEDAKTAADDFIRRHKADLKGDHRKQWIEAFVTEVQAESRRVVDRWAAEGNEKGSLDTKTPDEEGVGKEVTGKTHDGSGAKPRAVTEGGDQADHSGGKENRAGKGGEAGLEGPNISGNVVQVGAKDLQLILQTVRDLESSDLPTKQDLDDQTELVIGSSTQSVDDLPNLSTLSTLLQSVSESLGSIIRSVDEEILLRGRSTYAKVERLERVLIEKRESKDGGTEEVSKLSRLSKGIRSLQKKTPEIEEWMPKLLKGASKVEEAGQKIQELLASQATINTLIKELQEGGGPDASPEESKPSISGLLESQAEIKALVEGLQGRGGPDASPEEPKPSIQALLESQAEIKASVAELMGRDGQDVSLEAIKGEIVSGIAQRLQETDASENDGRQSQIQQLVDQARTSWERETERNVLGMVEKVVKDALSTEWMRDLIRAYDRTLSGLRRAERDLITGLPELFDHIEEPLRDWRLAKEKGAVPPEDLNEFLKKIQDRVSIWQGQWGIERLGVVGERFDRDRHELREAVRVPEGKDELIGVVKDVHLIGYGLKHGDELIVLKKAEVIRYDK